MSQNQIPLKEVVKISFILLPYNDELPSMANPDGYVFDSLYLLGPDADESSRNSRLNANRMLRAKKICGYVAERLEPAEQIEADGLRPEEYIELLCQGQVSHLDILRLVKYKELTLLQVIEHNITLATLRAHVWKSGGDVVLYYRSNGRKPRLGKLSGREVVDST